MSDLLDPADDAATPLTDEEQQDLIPSWITLRAELNEAEQANIPEATPWALSRRRDVLGEWFLQALHRRMFGRVWRWAGRYRQSARSIGIDACRIPVALHQLLDDARFWIENDTWPLDELAARFHHRLVLIDPFPNGNGRHARLATDCLLHRLDRPRFSRGRTSLVHAGSTRQHYIDSLRAADRRDLAPLLEFVRS